MNKTRTFHNRQDDVVEKGKKLETTVAALEREKKELHAAKESFVKDNEQLEENLQAYDLKLSDDILDEIGLIYKKYTDPTKAKN